MRKCSLFFSIFFKYKPFYITPPTERQKESYLCIKCQNAHLPFRGINTYHGLKNLMKNSSHCLSVRIRSHLVRIRENGYQNNSEYEHFSRSVCHTIYQEWSKEGRKNVPRMWCKKKINCFWNKGHSRTARVDEKKDKICDIVKKLLQKGESYLRHGSHFDNISEVFPLIREAFTENTLTWIFQKSLH